MFFIVANITTNFQMDASEFEGMIYNILSEEPFSHHILDMTNGNEVSTISDFFLEFFHHNWRNMDMFDL